MVYNNKDNSWKNSIYKYVILCAIVQKEFLKSEYTYKIYVEILDVSKL